MDWVGLQTLDYGDVEMSDDRPEQLKEKDRERRRITGKVFELVNDEEFRFGVKKAAQVLSGSDADWIEQHGFGDHPTYGSCSKYPAAELRNFISKLGDHKLLNHRDVGNYASVLEVRQKGEEVLDEEDLPLIVLPRERGDRRAASRSSHEISFEMFKEGKSPEEIAEKREIKVSTVMSHLENHVENGELDVEEIVDEKHLETIRELLESDDFDPTGEIYLSNVKDALPDEITYDEISLVIASYE